MDSVGSARGVDFTRVEASARLTSNASDSRDACAM